MGSGLDSQGCFDGAESHSVRRVDEPKRKACGADRFPLGVSSFYFSKIALA